MPNYDIIPNLKEINGKWTFTATLGTDPITGKKVQKRRGGFNFKKEAYEAYLKIITDWEIEKRTLQDKSRLSNITFKTFLDEWFIPNYRNKIAPQTFRTRMSILQNYYHAFYLKDLKDIKKRDTTKWYNDLLDERRRQGKTSHNHVRLVKQLLGMIFDYAIELEYCTNNPAREIKSVKKDSTNITFWTIQEFKKVINTFFIDDFYQHFGFVTLDLMFMTGIRIGEASALKWEDIDFNKGIIDINKTLIYENAHRYHFGKPKTGSSKRKIAIDQDTLNVLKEWKERQEKIAPTAFVLSYNSIPTNKHTVSHILKRHAKLAGVKRITPHGLRHSHASLLIHMKEDPLILKERLGHSEILITLSTYAHLYPNRDFELANRLNNVLERNFSKNDLTRNQGNQHLKLNNHSKKIR
ncbi:Transposase from transposon Tn916 [Paraliobacillus sp. PM-2]|uniref:site-specific integrase n=1 Tax=Paraliobacillus sp. PM-2 TaxID=1462524 RepID=UPI00061C0DCF|nr:site-specific integrase [Paraliobacillus sp. PM-2]CQR47389.1 Transposase from transposon Tn916 [Paraliobacillus sp. PM-2]